MHPSRSGLVLAVLAACGLLAGCGDDPAGTEGASNAGAQPQAEAKAPTPSAIEETKGMVSGVTNPSKPGAPVDLKFALKSRPEVGQPLQIDLALLPRASVEGMRATFIATDGLQVKPSSPPASYTNVQAGSVYRHTLTVVPREDGVYYVSAIVLMDLPNGPEARTFSIPVLVGGPDEASAGRDPSAAQNEPTAAGDPPPAQPN